MVSLFHYYYLDRIKEKRKRIGKITKSLKDGIRKIKRIDRKGNQ